MDIAGEDDLVTFDYLEEREQPRRAGAERLDINEVESYEDIQARDALERFAQLEYQAGRILFPVSAPTHFRYEKVLKTIKKAFDCTEDQDHEFDRDGLGERMSKFLSFAVRRSARKRYDYINNKEIIVHASLSTVFGWKTDLVAIIKWQLRLPKEDMLSLKLELDATISSLENFHSLARHTRRRLTFFTHEVRQLLESVLMGPHRKSLDVSIQLSAMIVTFYYTAARPSSLLKSANLPHFLKNNKWQFTRKIEDGKTVGISVSLEIDHWKGYSHLSRNRVKFIIGPVRNRINMIFELGLLMVAALYRRGAWGTNITAEQLWDGDGITRSLPPMLKEFQEAPAFLKARNAGVGLTQDDTPLKDTGAREAFRRECVLIGLDRAAQQDAADPTSRAPYVTTYALRRGTGTTLIEKVGLETAQKYLGHQIWDCWRESAGELTDDQKVDAGLPYTYTSSVAEVSTGTQKKLSVREAVESDPKLRQLATGINGVEGCIAIGSQEWMSFPPFRCKKDWRHEEAVDLLLSLKNQFKKRFQYWMRAWTRESFATMTDLQRSDVTKRAYARIAELKEPSAIPEFLRDAVARAQKVQADAQEEKELMAMDAEITAEIGADTVADVRNNRPADANTELEIQLLEPTAEHYTPDEREEDIEPAGEEQEQEPGKVGVQGDSSTSGTPKTQTATSTYLELQAEKRLYFLDLVQSVDRGILCKDCAADPTISGAGLYHTDIASHKRYDFHTVSNQLWRYLFGKSNGMIAHPSAFKFTPAGLKKPEEKSYVCCWCEACSPLKGTYLLKHIEKYHLDEIPVRYRTGFYPGSKAPEAGEDADQWQMMFEEIEPILEELPGLAMESIS